MNYRNLALYEYNSQSQQRLIVHSQIIFVIEYLLEFYLMNVIILLKVKYIIGRNYNVDVKFHIVNDSLLVWKLA